MSRSNVESGWRKSGIYPLNSEQPLNTPFMREQITREGPLVPESPPEQPNQARGESDMEVDVEENRAARLRIRDLEKQVRDLTAQNALLTT